MRKIIKVGMLGIGNIGKGTYQALEMNHQKIAETTGLDIEIVKILNRNPAKDRGIDIPKEKYTTDVNEILSDPDIDIVVELIGGIEPATTYMAQALSNGKSVVTANKAAIAANGPKLAALAQENHVLLRFEAAVAGGIPILTSVTTALLSNEFNEVHGILNGTTNYILTQMSEYGKDYSEVLKDAQAKGFAEADPTADVEGIDAANKLSILISLIFGTSAAPDVIPTQGITAVSSEDIAFASEAGYRIKLLASAQKSGGKVYGNVEPALVPVSHPLASVNNEITRGKLLLMPAVAVVTEGNIANAEQLKTFLSAATTEDTKSYRLVADIDCAGNTLPAAAGFGGVFDGQSHKVFNFKVSVDGATTGLFLSNAGTIKNVIFGSKDGESYDGVSEIAAVEGKGGSFTGLVADNNGTLENITTFVTVNFKAVAASAEVGVSCLAGHAGATSVIKNCVNKATLNASGTPTQVVDMGTIVGFMDKAGATVSGCSNEAKQTITLEVKKVLHIGGVIGRINAVVTVEDCANKADIAYDQKVNPSTWMSIGGVIGSDYNGGIVSGLTNTGNVSANTLQVVRIGGIMGVLNKSGEVRNCVNEGTVTLTQAANANWQSAGGIIGFQEASKGSETNPVLDNIVVGNTNKGAVTVTVENTTTHANKVAAGGILGEGCLALSVKDNTNTAAVKVTNAAAGAVYAGGIYGALIKNKWAIESTGNVNTGSVTASTSDNAAAMAGGVVGYIAPTSGGDANKGALTLKSEKNTGAVTCANAAAAGSIAGNNASATLENCIAGGSVNGTNLTESNLAELVQGSGSKGTVTGTIPVFSENLAEKKFTYDGRTYPVVKLADGKWWMAAPLAYVPAGKTVSADPTADAGIWYTYTVLGKNEVEPNVTRTDAYLYDYATAFGLNSHEDITYGTQSEWQTGNYRSFEGTQGICPPGWYIPTRADFLKLVGASNADQTQGETKAIDDPTAVYYEPITSGGSTVKRFNAEGWNFSFMGCRAKASTTQAGSYNAAAPIDGTKCSEPSWYGLPGLNQIMTSTPYRPNVAGTNVQFFCMMTTFTSTYKEGRLSLSYGNYLHGMEVRCVRKATE